MGWHFIREGLRKEEGGEDMYSYCIHNIAISAGEKKVFLVQYCDSCTIVAVLQYWCSIATVARC